MAVASAIHRPWVRIPPWFGPGRPLAPSASSLRLAAAAAAAASRYPVWSDRRCGRSIGLRCAKGTEQKDVSVADDLL
ncbi:hypothetical protein Cni_G17220 [Canna indica]|uniref:Uncharacterized protein n=1 Tax=Canna indica TaxID=4628 RepID=A0AAQ3KIC6_9LILI|nr:hypothetical protein Cni_G17220 [Canna indica]